VQYTRNMVTGASNADVAVVLVDARKGVIEQTRRHASIAALLRVPHVVLAVNKMDLVGWDEGTYDEIAAEFAGLASRLGIPHVGVIPISALDGDNVVTPSTSMPWYEGPSLLAHLETLAVTSSHDLDNPRLAVQYVILSGAAGLHDERRYAGQVAGGSFRPGDDVVVLPAGLSSRIAAIETLDGPLEEATPPRSVSVRLEDELDVGRGDLLVVPGRGIEPVVTQELRAAVCWLGERPLVPGARYALKHTTRSARAVVAEVEGRLDLDTLEHRPSAQVTLNDIGEVTLRTSVALVVDPYARNRVTGRFILVDEATNETAGAGLVLAAT
jgi:bifunctional enzyme CysN/CysC